MMAFVIPPLLRVQRFHGDDSSQNQLLRRLMFLDRRRVNGSAAD
jgi:hypothetical protein